MVLESCHDVAQTLYWISRTRKHDHSYSDPASAKSGGPLRNRQIERPAPSPRIPEGPISLYTIVSRQLHLPPESSESDAEIKFPGYSFLESPDHSTETPGTETGFTPLEISFLNSRGYSTEHVRHWIASLAARDSISASAVFQYDRQRTPTFLFLMFLRRRRMRAVALGSVMRHVKLRLQSEPMDWLSLRILVIRLLRRARLIWPESLPWIASLFCTEAGRIYSQMSGDSSSSRFRSSLTKFCNTMLSLISLFIPENPVIAGIYQEEAQFIVLQFMASREPALTVTRHGFRAVTSNQLTHAKTTKEKEWAMLKGPSWPPWKENRHAMDEDKDYMFAASRASRILHRLVEAGYARRRWEGVAEVYAGWDTDLSPTVQVRALLSPKRISDNSGSSGNSTWAARIRTTRTRREAWACFLAYEESDTEDWAEVYLAMFEKLHHKEVDISESGAGDVRVGFSGTDLLPGDMKEVFPDPKSPLHLVHLSEPVPSYTNFYHRMMRKRLRPDTRLLAFLLDTLPEFSDCLKLLKGSQDNFNGGIRMLLRGTIFHGSGSPLPDYFMASFIRFLCRFGRFTHLTTGATTRLSTKARALRLETDRTYLTEYAHELLVHLRLSYRPAWTAYMQKVIYGHGKKKSAESQYPTLCTLIKQMDECDVDVDGNQFQLLCATARYAAQAAYKAKFTPDFARHVLSTAPSLLRTNFHNLVGANIDPSSTALPGSGTDALPPHVPSPSVLQAYVRALGMLRDYEGLYSFSSWLTTYHREVTIRAAAEHSGQRILYRTLVALRAALEGTLDSKIVHQGAPQEITELVKAQVEGVEGWEWPPREHVDTYVARQAGLRS